jgi:hypothetical protein
MWQEHGILSLAHNIAEEVKGETTLYPAIERPPMSTHENALLEMKEKLSETLKERVEKEMEIDERTKKKLNSIPIELSSDSLQVLFHSMSMSLHFTERISREWFLRISETIQVSSEYII